MNDMSYVSGVSDVPFLGHTIIPAAAWADSRGIPTRFDF